MRYALIAAAIFTGWTSPATAQSVTIAPAPEWRSCAAEGATCASRSGALVRYGAGTTYAYQVVNGAKVCANYVFGDPAPGVVKTCAIASPPAVTVPKLTPTAAPVPAPVQAADPRAKLGINVANTAYWSAEHTFANQAAILEWRDPIGGWAYVAADRLRDGIPATIEPGHPLLAYLTPPAAAWRGEGPETRCAWAGTGTVTVGGATGKQSATFRWPKTTTPVQTVSLTIAATSATDPIRDIDCREPAEKGVFSAQLLDFLKPFGVIRFLDWSSANGNPASVTWATRGVPRGNAHSGSDGIALEHQIALVNAVGSSPWFTVPMNADADYQQRMAQMVHDTVPAGRPVYVELSNEVWNYQFGQAHQAQKEGLAAKLSDNAFQAAQYRYAQRVIDLMAVWSKVYADRPRDLVRVVATQAGNPWVGEILMDWDGGKLRSSIDAIAIAPYFTVDLAAGGEVVTRLGEAARSQIAKEVTAYAALAKRTGKRLIAYEAGQHLVDPARVDAMKAANRDPRMEAIYAGYIADWGKVSGDLMTLYLATSPITGYGAWGLREYAGQPMAETPKLRGVSK